MRGGDGYVEFHDGTRIDFEQPKNTLDPRYRTCTTHHTGCICREAEWCEEVTELKGEYRQFYQTMADVLAGHAACCCRCTGCEVLRRIGLTHITKGEHCDDH